MISYMNFKSAELSKTTIGTNGISKELLSK